MRWGVVSAVAAILVLAGCGSAPAPAPSASLAAGSAAPGRPRAHYEHSAAQKAELADGEVTFDEYKAAFRRYRLCLQKAGYEITEPTETNEVYDFGIPAKAVDTGVDDRCMITEWDVNTSGVNGKWQLAREDTGPQAIAWGKCLQKAGISPRKKSADRFEQMRRAGLNVDKCNAEYSGAASG